MKEADLNRRAFAGVLAGRTAAAALTVAATSSDAAFAQDYQKKKSESDAAGKNVLPESEPEEEVSETALLLGLILMRYPDDRLDETAIQGIIRQIHSDMVHSEILSSFPLENSDEPAFAFRAWTTDN